MDEADRASNTNPILVVVNEEHSVMSIVATGTTGKVVWVITYVCAEIADWGFAGARIILKSDNEPATFSLKEAVGIFRGGNTVFE